jgi:OFA family oxalate/formate antiporter-like MFS transporter
MTSFALAVSALVSGKLEDRWGIRRLASGAGIVLGVGLMLSSLATSLPMLYLFAGVLVGFADGTAYITTICCS